MINDLFKLCNMLAACSITFGDYYDSHDGIPTFRLPQDPEEKQRRMKALLREKTPDTGNTVVYERH